MSDFVPLVTPASDAQDGFHIWADPLPPGPGMPSAVDEYARGLADGQQLAEAAFAQEREQWQQLVAAAQALKPVEPEAVRNLICTTVDRLVREIVAASPVDTDLLRKQVDEAIRHAANPGADMILRLAPADLDLLDGATLPIRASVDPRLSPGTLRIDIETGAIEHGRQPQLDALKMALGVVENSQ